MDNPALRAVTPTPRVMAAAQLYGSGACKTKKEESELAGLHPNYLSMLTSAGNEEVNRIVTETQRLVADESLSMSHILSNLGRKAIGQIATLMESSGSEKIRLEAARDLADRTPSTAKTQSHTVTSFSLNGEDAREIAQALVASATARASFAPEVQGDYVKIEQSKPLEEEPT